ncbi:Hypothetical protein RADP37_04236 [Roseomonas mucosa]|uniref:Uncharacterized protein n=1 Tax=Roseomonas mucosa TaxID=207340 RepID=A0A4Y1MVZ4_9PROT|nr:Hypothetical protein RADP37_04236 [Roseomonas mucosa]
MHYEAIFVGQAEQKHSEVADFFLSVLDMNVKQRLGRFRPSRSPSQHGTDRRRMDAPRQATGEATVVRARRPGRSPPAGHRRWWKEDAA